MEGMDTLSLTIADAVEKSGRSPSTIRRLIRTIADDASHPDRSGVEPTPDEVEAFKKKGENFTWKIKEDILMKHLKGAPREEKKKPTERMEMTGDILSILQKELDLKSQQIEKQWEVIHALNDRLREGNILMGSLQQRLALPMAEPAKGKEHASVASGVSAEPSKKASKESMAVSMEQGSSAQNTKPAKKGLFRRIFR